MGAAIACFAVSALLLLGAGACLYWYFRQRQFVRVIEATTISRIGFAGRGYVALEGEAQPVSEGLIRSTLTGTPCCWYRFRVERRNSSDSGGGWTMVDQGTSAWPFLLRDASGVCAVGPFGAEVFATDRSVWYGETPRPEDRNPPRHRMTDVVAARLPEPRAPGHVSVSVAGRQLTSDQYRYKEECIYPGDELFVLGLFDGEQEHHSSPGRNYAEEEEASAVGAAPRDDDGAEGELTPAAEDVTKAWDYIIDSLHRQVPHAIAAPGSRRQPYVISALPPSDLARLQRGFSLGALVMALLLGAATAGVLIAWWKLR